MDGMDALIWLAVMIVCIIIEAATLGLTTIWFAFGSIAAFIAAMLKAPIPVQVALFIVVSIASLLITRPIAMKWFNKGTQKTNYQEIIGVKVKITQTVDNYAETGAGTVNGMSWTVRSADDDVVLNVDDIAQVVDIKGVKLIAKKIEED